ncbi:MAG: hypothetical protein OXH92_02670 [Bryobacterales bacterium]|nr:hypothetical protein [Bryobacterales bacterium]MDE0292591.1 hypothetical protein [Bryobacterales bacterium]MDE0432891.1 hypothetical protein [Bryobacterales bacterium]
MQARPIAALAPASRRRLTGFRAAPVGMLATMQEYRETHDCSQALAIP